MMKKNIKIISLAFCLLLTLSCFAQNIDKGISLDKNKDSKIVGKDTTITTPFFAGVVGWTFPYGEMGNRYDSFFNIDANLGWKTKNNWLFMLDFCFQFGNNNIKQFDQILATLITDDTNPFIIGEDGTDAGVVGYNRNLSLSFGVGRIIPLWFSNPNSGLMLTLNAGFIQHQIIYQYTMSTVPALEDDYAYGYDRQMRGPMASIFLGYMNLSKKTYANWYAGVQFNSAWTKMTRDYQFDLMSGDDKLYTDYMLTLKVGWMIPFFGRSADKIYFF
ncbi:MAG: hypothetical protein MJZ71_04220 [Bacteroidales bacterium]|nr:hypothetical protein [Bacteroidales bacterium]